MLRGRSSSAWALRLALAVGSFAAGSTGCKGAPDAQESARAEEKMNLLSNPSLFLTTSDREDIGEDGGDTEHQITSMTVFNSSHFALRGLAGEVVWYDDQDRRLGSTPFSLAGVIGQGQAKRFGASDGTMQSGKLKANTEAVQVVFTHVQVVEGEKGL